MKSVHGLFFTLVLGLGCAAPIEQASDVTISVPAIDSSAEGTVVARADITNSGSTAICIVPHDSVGLYNVRTNAGVPTNGSSSHDTRFFPSRKPRAMRLLQGEKTTITASGRIDEYYIKPPQTPGYSGPTTQDSFVAIVRADIYDCELLEAVVGETMGPVLVDLPLGAIHPSTEAVVLSPRSPVFKF